MDETPGRADPPLPPELQLPDPAAPIVLEPAPPAAVTTGGNPPCPPAPPAPASPPLPYAAAYAELAPADRASIRFLVTVTLASLAADLVTKGWAKGRLSGVELKGHGPRRLSVWKDHIDFIFAQNPGGAWSFLRGLPDSLRRPFFLVVSAAAIVFIVTIYQRVHKDQTAMRWGLPLALGGAMGNLADRIRYGWVVDFIDCSAKWGGREHHWPTFNVADIAIVAGVLLMGIDMLRHRGHHGA